MGVAFAPDGRWFVTGSLDRTLRIWDTASGSCQGILQTNASVYSLVLSADGKMLFSGSDNGTIQFWDLEAQQCTNMLELPAPYAGMDVSGVTGLTTTQQEMLMALGATP